MPSPELLEFGERVVPPFLQRGGNESVRWVDLLIASLGELGLILGSLDAHSPLLGYRLVLAFKLTQGPLSDLDASGLDDLEDPLRDRGVDEIAANAQAAAGREAFTSKSVAVVGRIDPTVAFVAD